MFEFLGVLVAKALEKILGEVIDIGKQSLLDRRKLFRKFFDLYESLIEWEKQSEAAYIEFVGYANGTEVLTKIVPRKKLRWLR
jgi:predicted esterase